MRHQLSRNFSVAGQKIINDSRSSSSLLRLSVSLGLYPSRRDVRARQAALDAAHFDIAAALDAQGVVQKFAAAAKPPAVPDRSSHPCGAPAAASRCSPSPWRKPPDPPRRRAGICGRAGAARSLYRDAGQRARGQRVGQHRVLTLIGNFDALKGRDCNRIAFFKIVMRMDIAGEQVGAGAKRVCPQSPCAWAAIARRRIADGRRDGTVRLHGGRFMRHGQAVLLARNQLGLQQPRALMRLVKLKRHRTWA